MRLSSFRLVLVCVAVAGLAACGEDKATIGPKAVDVAASDVGGDLQLGELGGQEVAGDVADDAPGDVATCSAASCDDGNPCTDDACDDATGCKHQNNTVTCDDGSACTNGDACKDGSCQGGPAKDCDDKNACTSDSCDKTTGCVTSPVDPTPCDDGDGCTLGETCKDSKCGTGAPNSCDDGNPCTDDTCDPTTGCAHTNNKAACSDGDACTAEDACLDGQCAGGSGGVKCDDKNPCTDDGCEAKTGTCVYLANAATCEDGDACTNGDACQAGLCAGQPACGCASDEQCNDKNPCTKDACEAGACKFSNLPMSVTCTDGDACTEGDACMGGKCMTGNAKACDDANACTDDSCVSALGCVAIFNAAACDDGNACTGNDKCQSGTCTGALTCTCKLDTDCDDKNACTDDACVAGKCASKASGAGKACEDGNGCTVGDGCGGGVCLPGKATNCDDSNACTDDACDPKSGKCLAIPNSTPCNDNNACTTADACQGGQCQGGGKLNCDDKNPCTNELCDAVVGCAISANSNACDDGDACSTADTCDVGKCVGGAAANCDDKNPCTDDSCDKAKGCVHLANSAACSDDNACTAVDLCADATCVAGKAVDCDDKNPCTNELCDAVVGCAISANSNACDDGDACTTADTCDVGKCVGGAKPDCDDKNPCTTDTCDVKAGCKHENLATGVVCADAKCDGLTHSDPATCFSGVCIPGPKASCDDGNVCSDDSCDPAAGCKKANNLAICDDGTACTKGDACKNGACQAGAPLLCDDGNPCSVDACDPTKGCVASNSTDGTGCKVASCGADGSFDKGSTCAAGKCTSLGAPESCDDKNPCTDDLCSPTGGCTHQNNSAVCDDKDACSSGDQCVAGSCKPGAAVTCDDKNGCTDDKCDKALGCVFTNNTSTCDDASVCTKGDKCGDGACIPGVVVDCDDKNVCTDEFCDAQKGCVSNFNTKGCDDGNACTDADTCDGSGICKGAVGAVNCDDLDPCTSDSCDTSGGCTHKAAPDGTVCKDAGCSDSGFTAKAVCGAGKCGAAPAILSCDDKNGCTTDVCNTLQGCVHVNNSSVCEDGNACTTGDTCAGGACKGVVKACDDKNPCTDNSCDGSSGCVYDANTSLCDDGNQCTTGDVCSVGSCAGGKAPNCDDANPCTNDSCDPGKGCVHSNNAVGCNDGNACTSGDVCGGGICAGSTQVQCDDKNGCTTDSCDPGKGCLFATNTALCNDGNACTTGDVCNLGKCGGAGSLACDDKNGCTNDSCDPSAGCVYVSNTAGCNDGNACTTADACNGGACVGGAAPNCDDKNLCTDDSCDSTKGCLHANNASACDDGTVCTKGDQCAAGSCKPGAAISCDDKSVCTTDTCDASTGCQNANNTEPCNDGNACNSNDICNAGKCAGSGGKDCNDNNPCTIDSCDIAGGCIHSNITDGTACSQPTCASGLFQPAATCTAGKCSAVPAPVDCNDKNVCTQDSCNALQGCIYSNNTSACNDNNACTKSDICASGGCNGTQISCVDGNVCTDDACDPGTGCVFTANSAGCNDSNACTTVDKCSGSACVGSVAPDCDDGKPCTDDACDKVKGCTHTANTATCDDGNACTTSDACSGTNCIGGAAPNCDDKNPCTSDSCDKVQGCLHANNTAACDDGDACTTSDLCSGGACVGGKALNCDDVNVCTTDSCDKVAGCKNIAVADGAQCANSSCNSLTFQAISKCATGKCVVPATQNCDDGLECSVDTCDATKGCAQANKAFGTTCSTQPVGYKYPFCAGSLCTGLEEITARVSGAKTNGVLTGIDRRVGGNIYSSGADNTISPSNGIMTNVAETPALGLQYNAALGAKSILMDVRNRLAVGSSTPTSTTAYAMIFDAATGFWKPAGGPQLSAFTRGLNAVDLYNPSVGIERYVIGGPSDSNENTVSTFGYVNFAVPGGWSGLVRLAVSSSKSSCNQMNLDIADVYAASGTAVYAVGTVSSNGNPTQSVVAVWDGNTKNSCDGSDTLGGVAYADGVAYPNSLVKTINLGAVPAIGQFRTIHGSAAGHMLVGGTAGTLYSFDGTTWTQQTPAYAGMPMTWGTAFDVRSVYVTATEGWVAGTVDNANFCRSVFVLHGSFAAGVWSWNKLIVSAGTDLTTCVQNLALTQANKVWIDAATSSVYAVGSQGVDSTGKPVAVNAAQQAEMILRIKMK